MAERLTVIHLEAVDAELRNRFKAACAARGQNMRDRLLKLIEQDVRAFETEFLRRGK